MSNFKKYLLTEDGKVRIEKSISKTKKLVAGTSLYKEFSKEQSKKILSALKNIRNENDSVDNLIDSAKPSEKYSTTILVAYKAFRFTIYAANGVLRIGADGDHTSTSRVLDGQIDMEDLTKDIVSQIGK